MVQLAALVLVLTAVMYGIGILLAYVFDPRPRGKRRS